MAKGKHKSRQLLLVSWNTVAGKVLLTVGSSRLALSADEAEYIGDHLFVGAEAITTAEAERDEIDSDLDRSLRNQLNSEVSAAMDSLGPTEFQAKHREPAANQGPAAPPSSSDPLGGTGRLAEELGAVQGTLAEILDASPVPKQIKPAFEGPVTGFARRPPHYETLMVGLAEHPTDPGKILIGGHAISLGHARNYGIALHRMIEAQQAKAFGRQLKSSVETPEPPVEIPTLRAE